MYRVAAYNVKRFGSGTPRVAAALAEAAPDVLFLNEVGSRLRLHWLGGVLGMKAAARLGLWGGVRNAVLLRQPWRAVNMRTHVFSRRGGLAPRGVTFVRAGHRGLRLTVAAVHLGLSYRERLRHAEELTDLIAGIGDPVIVGGDLNEDPAGAAARWIAGRLWDAFAAAGEGPGFTFPSPAPAARIDYVFVSAGIRVQRAWVGEDAEGSDHRPVFADVSIE